MVTTNQSTLIDAMGNLSSLLTDTTAIESMVETSQTTLGEAMTDLSSLLTDVATVESMLGTNQTTLGTIAGYTDDVESMLDTNEGLITTIDTVVDTIDSKVDSLESQNDTNESLLGTVVTQTAPSDAFSEFEHSIFLVTSGTLTADGNEEQEVATSNSTGTSYAIMASTVIGAGMSNRTVRSAYVDLGWTGQCSGGGSQKGTSKWAVISGSTPTLSGASDITDEVSETSTKQNRWRAGQIKLVAMNTVPFTVMLAGKVTSAGDTLTANGFAGSAVTVIHELA
jgi:hypothetical protein